MKPSYFLLGTAVLLLSSLSVAGEHQTEAGDQDRYCITEPGMVGAYFVYAQAEKISPSSMMVDIRYIIRRGFHGDGVEMQLRPHSDFTVRELTSGYFQYEILHMAEPDAGQVDKVESVKVSVPSQESSFYFPEVSVKKLHLSHEHFLIPHKKIEVSERRDYQFLIQEDSHDIFSEIVNRQGYLAIAVEVIQMNPTPFGSDKLAPIVGEIYVRLDKRQELIEELAMHQERLIEALNDGACQPLG